MIALTDIHGHTVLGSALSPSSVVIDLGAHRGAFAHGLLEAYSCRCYAVEANPTLATQIPAHPRLSVHNMAIAGHNGPLTLNLSSNPEASTILDRHGVGQVTIQALTVPAFLESIHVDRVDLIKFDIEGAEIAALDACSDDFLKTVPQLTVEFHDFLGLTPVATIQRIVARLERLGFFTLKMWRSAWGDTLFVNRALVEVPAAQLQYAKWITLNWRRVRAAVRRLTAHRTAQIYRK